MRERNSKYKHINVLGWAPGHGINLPRFSPPDKYVKEYLASESVTEQKRANRKVLDKLWGEMEYCMVNPTTDEVYGHIGNYDHQPQYNTKLRAWYIDRLSRWLSLHGLKDGSLGPLDDYFQPEEILQLGLDWSTGSGVRWRQQGHATKAEAWISGAAEECVHKMDMLRNGLLPELTPSRANGRGKLSDRTEVESNPNKGYGRMTWETCVTTVPIHSLVLRPITALMTEKQCGPAFGVNPYGMCWDSLRKHFSYDEEDSAFGVGVDVRRMDGHVQNVFTELTIEVLRGLYSDGKDRKWDALFGWIIQSTIGGVIQMPDGVLLHVPTGLCSGAPWVQIVESLLSVMLTLRCTEILSGHSPRVCRRALRIMTMGDDQWFTYLFGDMETWFDLGRYGQIAWEEFHLPISVEKSHIGRGTDSFFFLSRKMTPSGYGWRDSWETLIRWKYPEVEVKTPQYSFTRAVGLLEENPTKEVFSFLDTYLSWLEHEYGITEGQSLGKVKREDFLAGAARRWAQDGVVPRRVPHSVLISLQIEPRQVGNLPKPSQGSAERYLQETAMRAS